MRPVENIRISQKSKDQLISLKRKTGLKQWNELCRWALCSSLAEPTVPPQAHFPSDSNVEMTWEVFGGRHQAIYAALLLKRCHQDGLGTAPETVAEQFRLHLHRGIGYLAATKDLHSIAGLMQRLVPSEKGNGQGSNSATQNSPEQG